MPATIRRYAAFLRGVMPTNATMPDLKRAFERAGFTDVKTVLGTGNVVFSATAGPTPALERRAEAATRRHLGRAFTTFVRPLDALRAMVKRDPFRGARLKPGAKRIVSFLRAKPRARLSLPIELDGARILGVEGAEAFSAYLPNPRGPVFMTLIERTFGTDVTTRTWDTVLKVAK